MSDSDSYAEEQATATPTGDSQYETAPMKQEQDEQPQRLQRTEDVDDGSEDDDLFGDQEMNTNTGSPAHSDNNEGAETHGDGDGDEPDTTMMDLFGSDDDDENEDEDEDMQQTQTKREEDVASNKVLSKSYSRTVPEGKRISLSTQIKLSQLPSTTDYEFCLLRLPNVIGCDVDAFEENKYVEPSAASSIDNYIRWRTHYEAASDEHYRETNTKLVYWKDGTKSLMIGKDCYDIDEQAMHGNRDFIFAKLEDAENHSAYKLCHGKLVKKLNVRTSTSKSYKTLQQNLAKKHQRTKGSKQMTALQRRTAHGKNTGNSRVHQIKSNRNQRGNKKRDIDSNWLESGGNHGNSSDDEEYGAKMRRKMRSAKTSEEESGSEDESDSDEDSEESDDDEPIGQRI